MATGLIEAANTSSNLAVAFSASARQTGFWPTTALVLSLVVAQRGAVLLEMPPSSSATYTNAGVAVDERPNLFRDLLAFHERLARSQEPLPEDAARLLRQHPWELYD